MSGDICGGRCAYMLAIASTLPAWIPGLEIVVTAHIVAVLNYSNKSRVKVLALTKLLLLFF